MSEPRKYAGLIAPVVANEKHVERVLAARNFVGDDYLRDVRERAKARRKFRSLTLYERVQLIRGRS